ncbi:hypothetical protein AUJ68_06505 [Candidatus Woesearchaeota archaeon CG1_02_57_44]|nr:MAG: hypothetical protein AUJ68_06505 [Candidatus Woesearchaeota archaeon CG1_02_57_44]
MAPSARAIGIAGPQGKILEWHPGEQQVLTYTIIARTDNPIDLVIDQQEQFPLNASEFVHVEPARLEGLEGGMTGKVRVIIDMPEEFPFPGVHTFRFRALESSTDEQGMIVAKTGAGVYIAIRVPYPGKYPKLEVSAKDIAPGSQTTIDVSMSNLGETSIDSASIHLDIIDEQGAEVASYDLVSKGVPGRSQTTWRQLVDSRSFPSGTYAVKVTSSADGQALAAETSFRVGAMGVELAGWSREVHSGSINKITFTIESRWSGTISNVFGELNVLGKNVRTLPIDVAPFARTDLVGYLDLTDVDMNDVAQGTLSLYFGENISVHNIDLRVLPPKPAASPEKKPLNTTAIMIGLILLLVVANLFFILRRPKQPQNAAALGMPAQRGSRIDDWNDIPLPPGTPSNALDDMPLPPGSAAPASTDVSRRPNAKAKARAKPAARNKIAKSPTCARPAKHKTSAKNKAPAHKARKR